MGLVRFLVSRELIERVLELPVICRIMEINPVVQDAYEFVVEDTTLPDYPEPLLVQPTIHQINWDWNLPKE